MTFMLKAAFLDFVAAGGIVFHKHILLTYYPVSEFSTCYRDLV